MSLIQFINMNSNNIFPYHIICAEFFLLWNHCLYIISGSVCVFFSVCIQKQNQTTTKLWVERYIDYREDSFSLPRNVQIHITHSYTHTQTLFVVIFTIILNSKQIFSTRRFYILFFNKTE